jgi:t-SNARE complex subunit (syntaxin)
MARVAESRPFDEVLALRSELLAHQQEVARLSAQLQELKAMVGSQQQVLAYLGQELEAQQLPMAMAAAHAAPSAKKARVMRAKSGGKELSASRKVSREPSLNL